MWLCSGKRFHSDCQFGTFRSNSLGVIGNVYNNPNNSYANHLAIYYSQLYGHNTRDCNDLLCRYNPYNHNNV